MSVNRLVNIRIPVLDAIQDMGLDITKDVPTITRWASDAEREIGSYYSLKRKHEVLVVDGCTADIPCDASSVKGVLLGDFGCDCGELFSRCFGFAQSISAANTDTFLVIDKPTNENMFLLGGLKWSVQQGRIIFSQSFDKQKITIQYLGFAIDQDGFPMVMENHKEAIVAFIMYKYALRSRFTPNKMDRSDVRDLWKEWMRLCSHARADDSELTDSERQEIVMMIHDPWIGYGLEVGMHNRFEYIPR